MSDLILFIDESAEFPDRLRKAAGARFEIVSAVDAEGALSVLRDHEVATVVCEPDRPDGITLLEEVHRAVPETPMIVLTGNPDPTLLARSCTAAEPFRMAFKSAEMPQLCALLDEGVARDRRLRDAREVEEQLAFAHDSLRDLTAGLEERLMSQVEGLRILHRFALDLNAATSLEEIATLAAAGAYDLLGGHGVRVQIWDDDRQHGVVRADCGPEMSSDLHIEPLRSSSGEVGEIIIDRRGPRVASLCPTSLANLTLVSGPTAVAVANVLRSRERDQAQQATILALVRLAERRDNETGCHIERVSHFCKLVAEGLRRRGEYTDQITDRFIDHLVRSSPLHDIGKVGIPDSILLKPGKLSPGEWEIMKTHAAIGESTLDEVIGSTQLPGYLQMGRDIAGGHHERWDGTGYPRGLEGEAIPLSARILALADVYDALTSRRPYKEPWSHARAVAHVAGLAGNHLDPKLVAVFLEVEEQADRIRSEHCDDGEVAEEGAEQEPAPVVAAS